MTMKPVSYFIQVRGNCCEACGHPFSYYRPAQRHHCIQPRQKGKTFLDDEKNIELVCQQCHMSGMLDTEIHAIEFAKRQIARGVDVVGWYYSLPLKVLRFPNLRGMING
jgi:hypothetical protein